MSWVTVSKGGEVVAPRERLHKRAQTGERAGLDLVDRVARETVVPGDADWRFALHGDAQKDLLRLAEDARIGQELPQGDFVGGLSP